MRWRFTTVLLAALPLVTLGLLGAVSSAWLAVRRRTPRTRAAAVGFAAASVTEYVLLVVYPSDPGPPTWALGPLIMITWTGATAHFLVELMLWRREVLPARAWPTAHPAPYSAPHPPQLQGPAWPGQFGPPAHPLPPTQAVPPPWQPAPPVPPAPSAVAVPPTAPSGGGRLDDDTIGTDLGAELRLLGEEFGGGTGGAGGTADGAGGAR